MKERNLCIFAEKQRGSRLCLPALSMALMTAGLSVGCGVQAGLMVKDGVIAAITFFYPTAG